MAQVHDFGSLQDAVTRMPWSIACRASTAKNSKAMSSHCVADVVCRAPQSYSDKTSIEHWPLSRPPLHMSLRFDTLARICMDWQNTASFTEVVAPRYHGCLRGEQVSM